MAEKNGWRHFAIELPTMAYEPSRKWWQFWKPRIAYGPGVYEFFYKGNAPPVYIDGKIGEVEFIDSARLTVGVLRDLKHPPA